MASGADLESGNPLVTVHPLSRQLQRHALFVTLVKLDSALQPEPYLARAWQWDPSRRAVTFRLFVGLKWHDGTPTTAADVAFTMAAARDTMLGSPRAGDVAVMDSVLALNDSTVRIVFRDPRAALPTVLAELPIVPRHLLDSVPRARWRAHPYSTAPVGNGPFRFVSRTAGRQWRFARNAEFPAALGGPPHTPHIVVAVVDEAATKFAGLVSGELDVAGVSPTMAHLVERDPSLLLMTPPSLFSTVLAFNTTRAPFDDARVRRALSLSIDRVRLVRAAVAGFATPAAGAIPPGLPYSTAGAPALDTIQADSLLDAAGWTRVRAGAARTRRGTALEVTLLTVGGGDMAVEQLVQADLAARGVALTLRVMELSSFLATVRAPVKHFDVVLTGIPGDIALGHVSAMFATAQRGGALDYTGLHTALLDSKLAAARGATPAAAAAAWQAVAAELDATMPVAWLFHARGVQGRSRRLKGVTMDLRGELVSVARWTREDTP
ncbi:peptide ABC transporter substrate-binding protein [Gemmatimonas groenlandica]|uniref:Peptide ABC transporter substrate-binding protein n=1 Tax=Gemmatimonas groenlandica TaxID=2732249 RepID=A0A6M4IL28_9BACT|nr:peptide ABC transporter substrate-binding protein [Gemmatimonas groenlandica]QJR34765.1 peptide ABC transporter substrate-binding protein [Gemmatimonas groenlandica]